MFQVCFSSLCFVSASSRSLPPADSSAMLFTDVGSEISESLASTNPLFNGKTQASQNACMAAHWLSVHFEAAEEAHIARENIFRHYVLACTESNSEPLNAASFGKVIRSVFPTIATRRLGTRGNSKYVYANITDGAQVSLLRSAFQARIAHSNIRGPVARQADAPAAIVGKRSGRVT